jgi:transcriptional regulator with XRE-family HTH domain
MTGPEFKATLKRLGLSQHELSRRLGLAPSTVNRWAKGDGPVPQYAVAYLALLNNIAEMTKHLPLVRVKLTRATK